MEKIVLIILLLIPLNLQAALHSTEEWASRYLSPCPKKLDNRVCFDKTKRNFKRMLIYKKLMFKYLDEYNLPRWLATIPFIESEYTPKALSKNKKTGRILAVGLWQIAPSNLIYYLTTKWNGVNFHYKRIPKRNHAIKLGKNAETSTKVACKILKYLYEKYGKDNHETVVRAYNAGETRIDRARKGLGKPLKDETLNYFSQLMSLQQIMDGADVFLSD